MQTPQFNIFGRWRTGKLATWLTALSLSAVTTAGAQQVPVDLPGEAAIEAYLNYQSRPAYSAFAISRDGAWGASWSYGLIASAEQAAIQNCEEKAPKTPCMVVSIDGESIQETVDKTALIAQHEAAKEIAWPAVEANQVPIQIARNQPQIDAYREYLTERGHKAFAAAPDGSWGVSSGQINDAFATSLAIAACNEHPKGGKNCAVVDQNHQANIGRIAVKSTSQDSVEADLDKNSPELPKLESDLRDKERAMPLFAERWNEYQDAKRHKAYAVNRLGAFGMATDHATTLVAEEAALDACENRNQFFAYRHGGTASCFVIATNNFYDLDSVEQVERAELQPASDE